MAQALLEQGALKQPHGRPRKRPKRIVADKAIYRQRNPVARFFNRLKQNRRIATRYEKRAVNYLAMLTIAAILMWL